jgi:hypothetical protein
MAETRLSQTTPRALGNKRTRPRDEDEREGYGDGDGDGEERRGNQETQINQEKRHGKAEQRDKETGTKGPGPEVATAVVEWLWDVGVQVLGLASVGGVNLGGGHWSHHLPGPKTQRPEKWVTGVGG